LKLEYDKLLSTFAFNFNLRRYIEVASEPDTTIFALDRLVDGGAATLIHGSPQPELFL